MDHVVSPSPGDFDLHLFGQGTHRRLWTALGPQPVGAQWRFTLWAPNAHAVSLLGDFNGWSRTPLEPLGSSGVWGVVVTAQPGDHYKFGVVGSHGREVLRADPMARRSECPPGDASRVPHPEPPTWSDHQWMASRRRFIDGDAPLSIYEVHAPSFAGGDDWDRFADRVIPHVVGMGFSHLELLPVAEHPFGGSWGYQVSGFYSPTARLGDTVGLARLVDRCHAEGIGVICDWVPAHFVRDAWALGRFDGTALYEHADPRRGEHPDWGTYVFNTARHEVRNFLIANACYWLEEFHLDGLRVDAVASMLYLDYSRADGEWVPNAEGGNIDHDNVAFLRELNTVIADEVPDALMIAEESTAFPGVTTPVADGGLGFTHKWNMGWMHDTLTWARREPVHRRHHHGELVHTTDFAFAERSVLPLSHDEMVHGKGSLLANMSGDDLTKFATLRNLYAWQWSAPGAPLLFMGSEFAPWSEWDHTGIIDPDTVPDGPHRAMSALVAHLGNLRTTWRALWVGDDDVESMRWLDTADAENSILPYLRTDGVSHVVCVTNWTPVERGGYRVGLPTQGAWEVILSTDAANFGGAGRGHAMGERLAVDDVAWQGCPHSAAIDLAGMATVWIAMGR